MFSVIVESVTVNGWHLNRKRVFVGVKVWKVLLVVGFQMVSNKLQYLLRRHSPSSRVL